MVRVYAQNLHDPTRWDGGKERDPDPTLSSLEFEPGCPLRAVSAHTISKLLQGGLFGGVGLVPRPQLSKLA